LPLTQRKKWFQYNSTPSFLIFDFLAKYMRPFYREYGNSLVREDLCLQKIESENLEASSTEEDDDFLLRRIGLFRPARGFSATKN
jgi:hypothetical protein